MNKTDFIYYKLCEKYGRDVIFMKKNIIDYINMKSENNTWIEEQYLGSTLGPIEFYNIKTQEKIDLRKEAESGTFKN